MAITIISTPEEHTPAYNEQYFVASGTNTGQTNFKYVCGVYVDGTLVATEKFPPRPDNSLLYFDPQRIVEAYVKNDYQFDIDSIDKATDGVKKVIVAIDEEYGSPISGFTGTSGDYYVWNASYKAHDFTSYTYTSGPYIKELTNEPTVNSTGLSTIAFHKLNFNQKYFLQRWYIPFGNSVVGGSMAYQMTVNAYGSNMSLIQTSEIYNTHYASADIPERYLITANCSPYGLNLIKTNNPSHIITQTDPTDDVIPAATYYYDITYYNSSATINSETIGFLIDNFCSNYTRYVVHWLNELGGWESFTFNLLSQESSKIERKEYRNTPFYLNSNNKYVYSNSKGDRTNYNTVMTNKIRLNSNWVSDLQYSWLRGLVTSPDIKLEDSSGNLYAVKCTDNDYSKKLRVNEKIFNMVIELEFDYQDIRQRG